MSKTYVDKSGIEIPAKFVRTVDRKRDQVVNSIIRDALKLQEQLARFKQKTTQKIMDFMAYSAEDSGVKYGGKKGNVTLSSFDSNKKVEINVHQYVELNEKLILAKKIIDECLQDWGEGSSQEIVLIINQVFQVDKKGKVSIQGLLTLRTLNIKNEKWQKAMNLISDGLTVTASKQYLRFQQRKGAGKNWESILLDLAKIDIEDK